MSDKKFYDKDGNEVRSTPKKPIYKKLWFWLCIILLLIPLILIVFNLGKLSGDRSKVDVSDLDQEHLSGSNDENEAAPEDENNTDEESSSQNETDNSEAPDYTYEDFKGTYMIFWDEPYGTTDPGMYPIIFLNDKSFRTINQWDYDMESMITDISIEDNILTLEVDSAEVLEWGRHSSNWSRAVQIAVHKRL